MLLLSSTDVFQADPDYLANEEKYKAIKEGEYYFTLSFPLRLICHSHYIGFFLPEILGDGEGSESGSSGEESGEEEDSDEGQQGFVEPKGVRIREVPL